MIKVILCFIIIVFCGVIGYGISGYYIQRKKFFSDINIFLNSLKTDIGFNSKNLLDIINNNKNDSAMCNNFKKLLSNYYENLNKLEELNFELLFKDITILSAEEKETIFNFFKTLGKSDIFTQLDKVDQMCKINEVYLNLASDELKKYSSLYLKLGLIIGAFIVLIII